MEEITLGQNGLPPKKESYSPEEKAIIVAKAAEVGTHTVADAYGLDWHSMRHGKSTTLNMLILRSKQLSSFNPQMVKR